MSQIVSKIIQYYTNKQNDIGQALQTTEVVLER